MAEARDWMLLGRHGLMVALVSLLPVPVLDRVAENTLRRRLVRKIAGRHEVDLPEEEVRTLADLRRPSLGGCLLAVLFWPIKKLLRWLLLLLHAKAMADAASELIHRGILVEEAIVRGWLPGEASAVRAAADQALVAVDVSPLSLRTLGKVKEQRAELRAMAGTLVRGGWRGRPELTDEEGPRAADSLQAVSAVEDLVHRFTAEMEVHVDAKKPPGADG